MLPNLWLVYIGLGCLWLLIPALLMLVFPKRFHRPVADEAVGTSASKQRSYVQIIDRWYAPIAGASLIAVGLAMRFFAGVIIVPVMALVLVSTVHLWCAIRALPRRGRMQQPQTQPGQRPLGIAILAGLIGCVAVAGFSMAVVAFGKGASPLVELVVSMLVCLLFLAFAVGAWTLRRWAWYLGVALMVWVLSAPIIDLVNGEMTSLQALRLVTLALILVYLFTPRVKAAFGQGQPGIAN